MASYQGAVGELTVNVGAAKTSYQGTTGQLTLNMLEPEIPDDAIWDPNLITGLSNGAAVTTASFPEKDGKYSLAAAVGPVTYQTNVINGFPVCRWAGGARYLATNMPMPKDATSFTLIAVVRMLDNAAAHTILSCAAGYAPQWRVDALKLLFLQTGVMTIAPVTRMASALTTTSFALVVFRYLSGSRYHTSIVNRAWSGSVELNGLQATNGSRINSWIGPSPVVGDPCTLRMEPVAGTAVTTYTITPTASAMPRAPKDFKLQGANAKGGPYTDLDTRTGLTWPNSNPQTLTLTGAPPAYKYYQLAVTATASDPSYVQIDDVQLNNIAARGIAWESRINGAPDGWGTRQPDQTVGFSAAGAVPWHMGTSASGNESFAGDMAYVRIINGEVPLGNLVAIEDALLARFTAITPATDTNKPIAINLITDSSNAGTSWVPAQLTDGQVGGSGQSWQAGAGPPQSLTLNPDAKGKVTSYTLTPRTDAVGQMPSQWRLQGSNDKGNTWVDIDIRTGVTTWSGGVAQTFTVAASAAYEWLRLLLEATVTGGATAPSIAEIDLNGDMTVPPPEVPSGGASKTFTVGDFLFGVRYDAGVAFPTTMSASIERSLKRRGMITPGTALTVRKACVINGVAYAAGAAAPTNLTPAVMQRLLRGKILK